MRRIRNVVALSSVALLALIILQYSSIKSNFYYQKEIEEMNQRTQKIGQVYLVLNLLLDVETGARGYLLTGLPSYLEPFKEGEHRLPEELKKLNPYLKPNEQEQLSNLVKMRLERALVVINKKQNHEVITAKDLDIGKAAMDEVRGMVVNLLNKENGVLGHPVAIVGTSQKSIAGMIIGSLLAIFLAGSSLVYVFLEFRKRTSAEKKLQVALATSEAISREIDIGVIATDSLGNIIFSNNWIQNKISTLLKISDFFVSNELALFPLEQMLSGDINHLEGVELEIKGHKRVYNVNSSPFSFTDDQAGIIFSIVDITDSSKKMASLVSSKQMADVASRAKSDFLAKMSHEIRTPLNAILGVGEILSLSKLDKEQAKCLEIFKRSAITLNNLVNDILDLSKIEAGKIDIINEPFSLNSLVSSCTSIMDFRASQKGLLFTIDVDHSVDHFIGDEGRIRQIILNLLSNAIKFTEEGEVKFSVKMSGEDKKKDISFSVKDTGRGISSENISKLFTNYQQENSYISKEFGGTGLGLSLSQELARLMGGVISIKSELGHGAEFTLNLTLEQAEGEFFTESIDNQFQFNKMKILLVDDNQENRFIVRKYLGDFDVVIEEAVDGEDAIAKFKSDEYDLILMDINMPKKDGITATKDIRELEAKLRLEKTLIVALSANALSLEYTKALAAGCDDYLTKPISRLKLVTMIRKWVGSADGEMPLNINSYSEDKMIKDDEDANTEEIDLDILALVPAYLQSRQKDLETIKEAYGKKDMTVIAKLVHNIKGTALSYGQEKLDKVARKMETALKENRHDELEDYIAQMEVLVRDGNGH